MNKQDLLIFLKLHGYKESQIVEKKGGIEVLALKRIPSYEFDYDDFVNQFQGKLDVKKLHFLDPWTFTIEC